MEKLLTVPGVIKKSESYLLTGNHCVSLPEISPDAVIKTIAFLSGELRALVEFKGAVTPFIRVNGERGSFSKNGYLCDFIPSFSGSLSAASYSLSYIAPEGVQGFVCRFNCSANSSVKLELGFELGIKEVMRSIFHPYKLEGRINTVDYEWTNTLICELVCGKSIGGFGISCTDAKIHANGASSSITKSIELSAGESKELLFFVSVAAETDGIGLAAMDMRRRGAALIFMQEKLLEKRHIALENKTLEKYANFNMNFCLYFSCGYTLDTGELCLVTSKSTKYYVSSAFWSRDCFLWAFPALLRADPTLAKKALLCAFTKYLENIGIHALYIDGRVLYPGFELDELVAPVIALRRYVEKTGDIELLENANVKSGLAEIKRTLLERYDADAGLFSTELDASDDPVELKFNFYDNALCCAALEFMGERELPLRVKQALYAGCTVENKDKRLFAYSSEGERRRLYDNPPGSLALLPHYGFCTREDELWQNSFVYIYSKDNPYYYRSEDSGLWGAGCEHTPFPWAVSIINYILGCNRADESAVSALEKIAQSCPVACESFRLENGELNTGDAFATMAGFVSDGIFTAFGK